MGTNRGHQSQMENAKELPKMRGALCVLCAIIIVILNLTACSSKGKIIEILPSVKVSFIQEGSLLKTVPVHGVLKSLPNHSVVIRPPFSGIIDRILAAPNERIAKGEIVALMSVRLLEGEVKQARANLKAERLRVRGAVAAAEEQKVATRVAIARAKAALEASNASLTHAMQNLAREEKLYRDGIIAQKDVQDANLAAKQAQSVARADAEALKEADALVQTNVVKQTEIATAEQDVKNAEGNLATKLAGFSLAAIRSPISGGVASISASSGEMVSPSDTLLTIVDDRNLVFAAALQSPVLPSIRPGEAVRFTTPPLPGKFFYGVIEGISPQVDPESGAIPIIVNVKNANAILKNNMVADGEIIIGKEKGLLVPRSAVLADPATEQTTLVIIGRNNIARIVPVKVKFSNEKEAEIQGAIWERERVVVEGGYALPDGTKVNPVLMKER